MYARPFPGNGPELRPLDILRGGHVMLWRNPANKVFGERDAVTIEMPWKTPLDIAKALDKAFQEEKKLAAEQTFAWSSTFGYLSPDPLHCGTGLGIAAEFHLEALHLIGDLPAVLAGIEAVRFTAQSIETDGIRQAGHVFRISNLATLGIVESDLVKRAESLFTDLTIQELAARRAIVLDSPRIFLDSITRALALLQSARLLAPGEVFDMLSPVLLAASMGYLDGITRAETVKLMNAQLDKPELPPPESAEDDRQRDERDAKLADKINKRFARVRLNTRATNIL